MNFERAIQLLCDNGVDFVVIGGWAAIFHGSAHVTKDLDICYSRDKENLRRLAGALAPYPPRPREFPEGLPNRTMFTLTTELGGVDLLAEVPGVGSYSDALSVSVEVEAFGRKLRTLDLPALIRAKRAVGRPKDLLILPELEGLLDATKDS